MFTFFRQTNGERREVQVRSSDLTVQRLATVFKLSTQALYLEEEFSGRAEFRSERGTFNTTAWEQNATFRVEGETSSASFNTAVTSTSSASASGSLNRTFPTSSQFGRSSLSAGRIVALHLPVSRSSTRLQQQLRKVKGNQWPSANQRFSAGKLFWTK